MFLRDILPFLALIVSYQQDTAHVVAKSSGIRASCTPGVGFIVTNLGRRAERVVAFNQRGTAHGRYVTRQMAEVAVSRQAFADIPSPIFGVQCG
jgi:hypothetical protein